MSKPDGGPAIGGVFDSPVINRDGSTTLARREFRGLSIRDWFAGMALVGFLAGGDECHAVDAYTLADEMLKERERL